MAITRTGRPVGKLAFPDSGMSPKFRLPSIRTKQDTEILSETGRKPSKLSPCVSGPKKEALLTLLEAWARHRSACMGLISFPGMALPAASHIGYINLRSGTTKTCDKGNWYGYQRLAGTIQAQSTSDDRLRAINEA